MAVTSDGKTVATPQAPVPATALHSVHPLDIGYGHKTIIRGSAPAADAGEQLDLEYRPTVAAHWRTVDTGEVQPNGSFALAARLGRSGHLQVVPAPAGAEAPASSRRTASPAATTTTTAAATAASASSGTPALKPSPERTVVVRPHFTLAQHTSRAVVGEPARVSGHLLPGVSGRHVVLEARRDGRWVTVAHARTRRGGAFTLTYTPVSTGDQAVHVAFAGDRINTGMASAPEQISGMQYAEVSWYEDAGDTACGFHATYGIASRTLPCGSKVTFSYGGRSVTATVDDRGPFVYSRLYDLNQNTAAALGMNGVATVLASV